MIDSVKNKAKIIDLLQSLTRPGKEALIQWLEKSDFFTCPCSTNDHASEEGGLAWHSLNVAKLLNEKNERFGKPFPDESIVICGLLHDICKVNTYVKDKRNKKIDGVWHEVPYWSVKDQYPCGHGEKSVIILQQFMKLTDQEIMAIRWHMGGYEPGTASGYPTGYALKEAKNQYAEIVLLQSADNESAFILEHIEEKALPF